MKVKKLIELLEKQDPESEVFHGEEFTFEAVEKVITHDLGEDHYIEEETGAKVPSKPSKHLTVVII